tara:strand:- start:24 stop:836 length:813 start_codon:yes stop_codon:yes gene_type:complete
MQYQAALQLAQQAPQLYDMGKLHRQMLEVLGIQDASSIIKLPEDIKPADPVTENMAMLKQEPVKAFKYQDHEAHIRVHLAAANDPKIKEIVGQSPFAGAIQAALAAHITEHVAFQYRKEIEKNLGVAMPNEEKPLPEDAEEELSRLTAAAAEKLLKSNNAEAQQEAAKKQQQDPLTQIQQRELAIKEQELEHKKQMDIAKLELDAQKAMINDKNQTQRLESENKREGARLGVALTKNSSDAKIQSEKIKNEAIAEGTKIAIDMAKELTNE